MKKIYFLFIVSFLLRLNSYAQEGWNLIYTFNQDVQCIAFKDSLIGFAAPDSPDSRIFKTTDGGITWDDLTIDNLNSYISEIIFYDNDFGIGVGSNGTLIKTTDREFMVCDEYWRFC